MVPKRGMHILFSEADEIFLLVCNTGNIFDSDNESHHPYAEFSRGLRILQSVNKKTKATH